MNWVLTIPMDFSLCALLKRSKYLLLPPFSVVHQRRLERVERLSSGKTLLISLTQIPAGLHLCSDQRLSGLEAEEVSQKVWRLLRLGENFSDFSQLCIDHPLLDRCLGSGFRFLRGATFFEDMVKAQISTHGDARVLRKMSCGTYEAGALSDQEARCLTALVDHIGSALATNPTRHAFPTPSQVSKNREKVMEILGPDLGTNILMVAERFLEAPNTLAELLHRDIPLETVSQMLWTFPGMTSSVVALAMLALGHYDYLPLYNNAHVPLDDTMNVSDVSLAQVRDLFTGWHPWSGLVYWLWDWEVCPLSSIVEEVICHEQTAH